MIHKIKGTYLIHLPKNGLPLSQKYINFCRRTFLSCKLKDFRFVKIEVSTTLVYGCTRLVLLFTLWQNLRWYISLICDIFIYIYIFCNTIYMYRYLFLTLALFLFKLFEYWKFTDTVFKKKTIKLAPALDVHFCIFILLYIL